MNPEGWNSGCRKWLERLLVLLAIVALLPGVAAAVEVGEKAPDFELPSTMGGKIRLSDFIGKKNVILEFYMLDFAPVWFDALKTRRVEYQKLKAMHTEIVGISAFNPWSQLAFANTMKLPYPLLSDFPDLTTIKNYGVESQIGSVKTAKRAYFIVDKKGIVRFKRVLHPFNPEVPFLSNQVLLDELEKINKVE